MIVEIRFWMIFVSALVPLVIGAIWYNPKVFGTAWMKEAGVTKESMEGANMALIFGLSYVFALLMSFALIGITIHQMGVQSLVMDAEQSTIDLAKQLLGLTDGNFRTFKHGAAHGLIAGIGIAFSVLATNAMFERKSWKYIWINSGYWIVSMTLMGGVVCQFM
ncbi:MAG: DUF1761 domain-containing protein [Flavobacteriales bacterium]|nr:DUF1761 domain-containing protein [Flavobacteriales bacterium]